MSEEQMKLWKQIQSWLRATLRRSRMEREMDAELRFHIEAFAEDLLRAGVPRQEPLRQARVEFGGIERTKEECREARGVNFIDSILQDLRYGLRILRKNPGLTFLAVLTTSLGIAANVTVFSIVDALFLRSVPAKNPEGLVRILAPEEYGGGAFSIPEFSHLRQYSKTVDELTAHYSTAPLYVSAGGETGEVQGAVVSSSYFPLLGLRP